jgi:hypothetical protein
VLFGKIKHLHTNTEEKTFGERGQRLFNYGRYCMK